MTRELGLCRGSYHRLRNLDPEVLAAAHLYVKCPACGRTFAASRKGHPFVTAAYVPRHRHLTKRRVSSSSLRNGTR